VKLERTNQERSFGIGVGGVLIAVSLLLLWKSRFYGAGTAAVIGVTLLSLGLTSPALLRLPSRLWWRFAVALGWLNSRIVLTLIFFVVLTPLAIVWRLVGRDELAQRKVTSTSWSRHPKRYADPKHYLKMY
jgi:saxitoxin biosynthesis operon SxtJ-like protein